MLLMEEIQLTTWDEENPVNNGIKYQPQLVLDGFLNHHQQYDESNKKTLQLQDSSHALDVWRPKSWWFFCKWHGRDEESRKTIRSEWFDQTQDVINRSDVPPGPLRFHKDTAPGLRWFQKTDDSGKCLARNEMKLSWSFGSLFSQICRRATSQFSMSFRNVGIGLIEGESPEIWVWMI